MKLPQGFQTCNEMTLSAHLLGAVQPDSSLEGSFLFELTTTTGTVLGNSVPGKVSAQGMAAALYSCGEP